MIKRIDYIKNYGIFRTFKWQPSIPEFLNTNLFYGLNGSGKSTLATVFEDVKNKEQRYYKGDYKLIDNEIGDILSTSLQNQNENIYVFNSHFVKNNIGEFDTLKGIIYISEENKEAKIQLDKLLDEKERLKQEFQRISKCYIKAEKEFDDACIKCARNIKNEFIYIGGAGEKYANYNKALYQDAISKYIKTPNLVCSEEELNTRINGLRLKLSDKVKPIINEKISRFDIDSFFNDIKTISERLSQTFQIVLKQKIGDDVFSWIAEGYRLHTESEKCIYCGNIISSKRKQELDELFSAEMKSLISSLDSLKTRINCYQLPELAIARDDFYSSQQSEVTRLLSLYKRIRNGFLTFVDCIITKIQNKIANPYESIGLDVDSFNELKDVNMTIDKINYYIDSANKTTEDFKRQQQLDANELEKVLVIYNYRQQNISELKKNLDDNTIADLDIRKRIKDNEIEIARCEAILKNEVIAGNEFNKLIHSFLGRNEFELKYDEKTMGYKIVRKENGNFAQNLSEGEKTAIAFIYFLTKVRENGNDISNSIIVFDDPISSFDSNHLYNAYSYIVVNFATCKQLFILTHNFKFFKLLYNKFSKKEASSSMYLIDTDYININGVFMRCAKLGKLPKSIGDASSEYNYLFDKAYKFYNYNKNKQDIQFDEYMQMANTCRRLLESFSSFKVQTKLSLYDRIERLFKCNKGTDYKLTKEEASDLELIYRFINSFSHNETFEEFETTDIVLGELHSIVGKVLDLIKQADSEHYNALIRSIS